MSFLEVERLFTPETDLFNISADSSFFLFLLQQNPILNYYN